MLEQIPTINLSKVWHLVYPGIEEILDDLNKECIQEFWIPEDVYTSLRNNQSVLLLGDIGFVIVQIRNDIYTGVKQFFVWMGYSFNPEVEVMEHVQVFLEELAKQWGCEMMAFASNRVGFRRKAKDMGYCTGPTNYVKRI
jgi:hypothetical protein